MELERQMRWPYFCALEALPSRPRDHVVDKENKDYKCISAKGLIRRLVVLYSFSFSY